MTYTAEVVVQLKPVVNDPQGLVVRDSLRRLGFEGVHSVRVAKHIEIDLDAESEAYARELVTSMSEKLLRNPVIEDARIIGVRANAEATA